MTQLQPSIDAAAAGPRAAGTPSLSVIIAAKNEALHIEACVQSARFADEVLVLDSGSTDATAALATAAGARVVATDWPGYGPQQVRGIGMARGEWVLSLDADEQITPELQAEILQAIRSASADGFRLPRLSAFCGQYIHHSGWRPDYTLRLARRAKAGFTSHLLHAHMTVDGTTRELRHSLVHDSYRDLDDVLEKLNRYSRIGAQDMLASGKTASMGKAVTHAFWAFLRTYLLRQGFRDGRQGFVLAVYNAETTFYKYLKLMALQDAKAAPPGDRTA